MPDADRGISSIDENDRGTLYPARCERQNVCTSASSRATPSFVSPPAAVTSALVTSFFGSFTRASPSSVISRLRSGAGAGIVDEVIERGEGDFVTDIAATLPLRIIVDMMGIPRSQEKFIFDRTNVILGLGDPEYVPDQTGAGIMGALLTAARDLSLLITELGEARVKDPKDDVTSTEAMPSVPT